MIGDREVSERLAREVGLLAGRLAEFLAAAAPPEGPLAEGVGFLRAMSAAALSAPRRGDGAAPPAPLDRLAGALGLAPAERDLLLLAGLAEEHEGYAAALRTLHPRGEPYPSAGLAAQLLCRDADERRALRGLL